MAHLAAALARIDELIAALKSGALLAGGRAEAAALTSAAPTRAASGKAGKKATKPAATRQAATKRVAADEGDALDKAQLVVGRVMSVTDHPSGSEKLWLCKVDLGPVGERQVVAGLRQHIGKADLAGRLVAVVANLKPAKLAGELSEAMILAADHHPEGGDVLVRVLAVPQGIEPGTAVVREGHQAPAQWPKECKSKGKAASLYPWGNPRRAAFPVLDVDLCKRARD